VEPPPAHARALVRLERAGSRPDRSPVGDPDVAIALAVVTACHEHGGPAAEPLDRAAGVLRSRAAERAERRVQSAQARLSATVLTWLPIAVLGVMLATSPAVRRVVVSPLGATIVTVGTTINLLGWWWMRRIVERAAR
jgi:tight adherence protein B